MNAQVFGHERKLIVVILSAILALPGTVLAQGYGGGGGHSGGHGGMHGGGSHGGGSHGGSSLGARDGFHGRAATHAAALPGDHGGASFRGDFHGRSGFPNGVHDGLGFHDGFRDGFHDGFHDPHGFHDGFHNGFHGGPGFHDGFHGSFHQPFYRPFFHNHIFVGGLAVGAFVATLPLYYSTFWYGSVPYYYYGNTYLMWDDAVGQYQVVPPPPGAPVTETSTDDSSTGDSISGDLYAYPKNGQSEEQQQTDRYECHKWAVDQSGFDPTAGTAATGKRDDYLRAEGSCLEGRGYSVE